jgi:very-short-patch-repair endonuclease
MRAGQKRDTARKLRHNATDAELAMWFLLRDRRLGGVKFRRQVPIGPYVADFASIQHRLVVELDGGQYADSARCQAGRFPGSQWLAHFAILEQRHIVEPSRCA